MLAACVRDSSKVSKVKLLAFIGHRQRNKTTGSSEMQRKRKAHMAKRPGVDDGVGQPPQLGLHQVQALALLALRAL